MADAIFGFFRLAWLVLKSCGFLFLLAAVAAFGFGGKWLLIWPYSFLKERINWGIIPKRLVSMGFKLAIIVLAVIFVCAGTAQDAAEPVFSTALPISDVENLADYEADIDALANKGGLFWAMGEQLGLKLLIGTSLISVVGFALETVLGRQTDDDDDSIGSKITENTIDYAYSLGAAALATVMTDAYMQPLKLCSRQSARPACFQSRGCCIPSSWS